MVKSAFRADVCLRGAEAYPPTHDLSNAGRNSPGNEGKVDAGRVALAGIR